MTNDNHIYPDVFTSSDSVKNINIALVEFNKAMGKVSKTSSNPFFKSDYAALPQILDAIKDPMNDNGLSINHFPVGDNRLVTRLSHISGEYMQGVFFMKSIKDTPQDRGSVITYMMRYSTGAALGLSIDKDDDGNKSSGKTVVAPKKAVLKQMTKAVHDAMIDFIDDGEFTAVQKKLPTYKEGKLKKDVASKLSDGLVKFNLAKDEQQQS